MSSMLGCHPDIGTDYRKGLVLAAYTATAASTITLCIPILSGTTGVSLDKLLPIGQLSDDIRIEITLEGIQLHFVHQQQPH